MTPKMLIRNVAFTFILLVVLAPSLMAHTLTIDNLPRTPDGITISGGIGALGEYTPFLDGVSSYYGQTFMAPSTGNVWADKLTFSMASFGQAPGPVDFRILLVDAATGVTPANPLFESSPITFQGNAGFTDFTVSLRSTKLTSGSSYAWIIDTFADRDGISGLVSVGTKNGFAGGNLFTLNVLGGSRDDHSLSIFSQDVDLAFSMSFLDRPPVHSVPEPSSMLLLSSGLFMLLALSSKHGARAQSL